MSELKTCPFCGCRGTGPLWHSKNCYITLLYDVLENGYSNIKEPPVSELTEKWNARVGEWVSVDDIKPSSNFEYCVDVWSEFGRQVNCSYCHERNNWYTYNDDLIDGVTHWMEQPLPPVSK